MSRRFMRVLQCSAILLSIHFVAPALTIAQSQPSLTLIATTPLPGISGDFDHFAYDFKRNRLISAAEENHTLEIFDLKTGKHLQSIGGFKAPHSIAYVQENDELFISDGDDASCVILSAVDFHRIGRIPLAAGADAALYDVASKRFYIGNGGREEKKPISNIAIISVTENKKIGQIPIDGNNIEAMAVDHVHNRMFVNIRDKKQIGVIDLSSNKTVATWTAPGMNLNTTLRFDESDQRVFVAGRTPGKFFVFDSNTGAAVVSLDCVDRADDMTWDAATQRIFITGSKGISIFKQQNKRSYVSLGEMSTVGGKTSIYVPELKRLYVAHPKDDKAIASILIYQVGR